MGVVLHEISRTQYSFILMFFLRLELWQWVSKLTFECTSPSNFQKTFVLHFSLKEYFFLSTCQETDKAPIILKWVIFPKQPLFLYYQTWFHDSFAHGYLKWCIFSHFGKKKLWFCYSMEEGNWICKLWQVCDKKNEAKITLFWSLWLVFG